MAKKPASQKAQAGQPSRAEASALGRLGGGSVPVKTLVEGLRSEGHTTDSSVRAILSLQKGRKVEVVEATPYSALGSYAWSPLSLWFWSAAGAVVLSLLLVSVTSGLFLYLRYVFGGALILYLPGYALIEALYPKRVDLRVGSLQVKGELDELTRFALSIGLSLAIVPLDGLALNYTPWGIRLIPVAVSLAGITLALLVLALTRKHAYYKLAKGVP